MVNINIRYLILVFYILLFGSTGYLLLENLGSKTDPYALFFQVILLAVCATGFAGTILDAKFSKHFNKIFLTVINGMYGLALLNAIFFNELSLISFREIVLYLALFSIDYKIISRWIKKYKKEKLQR